MLSACWRSSRPAARAAALLSPTCCFAARPFDHGRRCGRRWIPTKISPEKRCFASRPLQLRQAFYSGISERDIAALFLLMARLFPRNEEAERATGF